MSGIVSTSHLGGVAVGVFGDGTANQAYFHECLNFAKVMNLPVLFVCENNQYICCGQCSG